mgnify:CR=1 FL=1
MSILEFLHNVIFNYTIRNVTLGAFGLGAFAGILGVFAVLRKQSLLGDAVSHSTLPGVAVAFLLIGYKNYVIFTIGAIIAGLISMAFFTLIINNTRIKSDSALGLSLSIFFGMGLVITDFIKKLPGQAKGGLESYILGQAATIVQEDVIGIFGFGIFSLIILLIFWKEFKLFSFDKDFCASKGFNSKILESMLTTIIVIAIVIGLSNVGVILMAALIVAPATAARQWTNHLSLMAILAGLFGGLSGIIGAYVSSTYSKIPTGPTIVVAISVIVFISIIFAPNRGLLFRWLKTFKNKRRILVDTVLIDLLEYAQGHENKFAHSAPVSVLKIMTHGEVGVKKSLKALEKNGMVKKLPNNEWKLTKKGFITAEKLEVLGNKRKNSQKTGEK